MTAADPFALVRPETALRAARKRSSERVVCFDIPDDDAFMQPELAALLERKVGPHL